MIYHILIFTARDCTELLNAGFKENGVYTVDLTNKTSFEVFCDMKTDGGGWTVFHKRFNGFVGFYRGWGEYKNGFGDFRGEFWLRNEKIHQLTEIPRFYALCKKDIAKLSYLSKSYSKVIKNITRRMTTAICRTMIFARLMTSLSPKTAKEQANVLTTGLRTFHKSTGGG